MNERKHEIKNIIFDLGGVVLDLDVNLTIQAFVAMGFTREELSGNENIRKIFWNLEIGKISPDNFIQEVRQNLRKFVPEEKISKAWNAMILGFKPEKIKTLRILHTDYRTFLLSNTNIFHEKLYSKMLLRKYDLTMDDLFEKVYYSHELGMGKPDPEIFRYILKDSDLEPRETLFVDDSVENIQSARILGIQCLHFQSNGDLGELIKHLT